MWTVVAGGIVDASLFDSMWFFQMLHDVNVKFGTRDLWVHA